MKQVFCMIIYVGTFLLSIPVKAQVVLEALEGGNPCDIASNHPLKRFSGFYHGTFSNTSHPYSGSLPIGYRLPTMGELAIILPPQSVYTNAGMTGTELIKTKSSLDGDIYHYNAQIIGDYTVVRKMITSSTANYNDPDASSYEYSLIYKKVSDNHTDYVFYWVSKCMVDENNIAELINTAPYLIHDNINQYHSDKNMIQIIPYVQHWCIEHGFEPYTISHLFNNYGGVRSILPIKIQ